MEMQKEVKILNLDDILPNRFQPRIKFNESAILELAESIKEHGVIQPIVVRKISDKYEIIAGERRYKASVLAGKTTIPAIITDLDDKNSAEIALIENVQRQDLTPIEEAISYKKILDMGYLNQSELADKLGKTQSTIANKLRLLNLAEEVQEALLDHQISERHARSLLKLDEEKQSKMLERIITERLTVRKTDEEIKKLLESSSNDDTTSEKIKEKNIVEVLNLDLEGKEEQKMNKELNIPTQQIIEPIEEVNPEINVSDNENVINSWSAPQIPVEPVQPITPINTISESIQKEPSVAPGFMDINKIENEAKDIYMPESAPADLDMLLKNEPKEEKVESPMAPLTPEVNPTEVTTEQQPAGKFFNMFNFSEVPPQTEDLEEKQVNMDFGEQKVNDTFMFNFNPIDIPSSPAKEELQTIPETETISDVSAFNPFNNEPSIAPSPTEPINPAVESTNKMGIESQPVPSELNYQENNSIDLSFSNPVELSQETEVPNNQINLNEPQSIVQPESSFIEPTLTIPQNSPAEIKVEEPVFEPFNPYSLDNNNEFRQENDLNNYRIEAEIPEIVAVEQPKSTYAVADMRMVINTIRDCAKTLENYGFKVDLDELDFEDRYEVKFVVDKK